MTETIPHVQQGELVQIGQSSHYVLSVPEAAANAGIVIGERMILLVDTRLSPALGEDLVAAALHLAGPGDRELVFVNTHAHGDHIFGNSALLGRRGFSAENVRQALNQEETWRESIESFSSRRPYLREQLVDAPRVAPTIGLQGTLTVDLGGVTAELITIGKAHTSGDLIVRVPSDRVVYTADLLYNGHWPVLEYGDYDTWMSWLDRLIADDESFYVPGHGPGGGPEVVRTVRASWDFLVEQVAAGRDGEQLERALDDSPYSAWLHRERLDRVVAELRKRRG